METTRARKIPTIRELFERKNAATLANKILVDRAIRRAGPDAMVVYEHAGENIARAFEKLDWAEGDEVVAGVRIMASVKRFNKRRMKKAFKQARAILLAKGYATSVIVRIDGPDTVVTLVYHHRPYP